MALWICVRIARFLLFAAALSLPILAADYPQLLAEFQKTRPEVTAVHVIAETPLVVAVTGPQQPNQHLWSEGELLGVFAHRGSGIVPIAVVPNQDETTDVRIADQTAGSISLALGRGAALKMFFDPKTYFPKRIVRFAPVQVTRIGVVAGVLTLTGTDGKQDFTAKETNGTWRISTAPATPPAPARKVENEAQVTAMPQSMPWEFEKARPQFSKQGTGWRINEEIGPFQRAGTRLWVGKTFYDGERLSGVGDIGYYDLPTQKWEFLHVPEMADWSTSALLVEPDTIWVGRVSHGEDTNRPGGLLKYDRATHRASVIPLPDTIEKIVRVGKRLYCGTSAGFAIVDLDRAKRYEFTPQIDGSYAITPVM
jgi:hypothetical protein